MSTRPFRTESTFTSLIHGSPSESGPTVAEGGPEESVEGVQYWPRPFPFQHRDLLSEGEDFEGGIAPTAKENRDADHEREDRFEHELTFVTCCNVASSGRRCRIASC